MYKYSGSFLNAFYLFIYSGLFIFSLYFAPFMILSSNMIFIFSFFYICWYNCWHFLKLNSSCFICDNLPYLAMFGKSSLYVSTLLNRSLYVFFILPIFLQLTMAFLKWNSSKYIQLCFLKAVPSLRKNSIEQNFGVQGWMPGGLQMMFLCISNQRWLSLLFLMLQKGWKFSLISLALLISASQSLPVRFIPYFWRFIFQIHSLVPLIL